MAERERTAEALSRGQREISISEFFQKNRHLLGYDNKLKALLTIVKEAVDNSLDATEEARILPEIYVKVEELKKEKYKVVVRDNGPGIVKKQISRIFGKLLYGSKFHRLLQSLGWGEPIIIRREGRIEILPIGEFVDSFLGKGEEEKDISGLGIEVPAFGRDSKEYRFRKLSRVIRHRRMNEILRITTETNRQVSVTGCHSLFKLGYMGRIKDVEARDLKVGDSIIAPKNLPPGGEIREINILDYLDLRDIRGKWIYVYGIGRDLLESIVRESEIIHKVTDKSRKYYRVTTPLGKHDILDDSMKQYLSKGFLPLHLVLRLGLKDKVRDCVIQTYRHGKKTKTPVTWELTPSLMRFLGLFVAEGHVDVRQIGFTFGRHESGLIDEVVRTARTLGSNVTIEQRDKSVRVKVFANILPILMEKWVKRGAVNKRLPEFAFRAEEELRQHLLDGLCLGDGHMVKNRNSLMYNTISRNLANDIMYLWLMQGVLACLTTGTNRGLGRKANKCYAVSIHGEDIWKSREFSPVTETRRKRIINSGRGTFQILRSDVCQLRIRKIERITEGEDFVYDLSVPEHENFVGGFGGVSCHNSRGQQGIGVSGCVLYSQVTTGEPTIIITSTGNGKTHKYKIKIDVKKNEPHIVEGTVTEGERWHGVQVTFVAEGLYREHKQSVVEYLKQTAISNPHAHIVFDSPNGRMEFHRGVETLPKEPSEIKPHLRGTEVGVMSRMLQETKARSFAGFLTTEFSRVGRTTALEVSRKAGIDPMISPRKLEHKQVTDMIDAIKEVKLTRPPTDCLSPLGDSLVTSGLEKELNPEFVASISRSPAVYRGWPFQVEVGIAYGGSITEPKLMRFANRVPLLYQAGDCAITKSVTGIDWRRYGLPANIMSDTPVAVFVHMISVWVPFTSESKEAIANYPAIIKEMKLALQECARKLGLYLGRKTRGLIAQQRREMFRNYSGEIAVALSRLTGEKESLIKGRLLEMAANMYDRLGLEDLEETGDGSGGGEGPGEGESAFNGEEKEENNENQ